MVVAPTDRSAASSSADVTASSAAVSDTRS
jgi:hypothetical protein